MYQNRFPLVLWVVYINATCSCMFCCDCFTTNLVKGNQIENPEDLRKLILSLSKGRLEPVINLYSVGNWFYLSKTGFNLFNSSAFVISDSFLEYFLPFKNFPINVPLTR